MRKKVIFLMGPTASGKTALGIALTSDLPPFLPIELISVDATQVYRDLNIGSGKPDPETLIKTPHHLIDIRSPVEPYSAANFVEDVEKIISDILQRNKIPVLVGGTMLYFHALENGLHTLPHADPKVRAELEQEAMAFGWQKLYEKLQSVDPLTAARLNPNDKQRIQRALEIYEISEKPLSEWLQAARPKSQYDILKLALIPKETSREVLHHQINARVDNMIQAGLIDEVKALREKYALSEDCPSMRAAGYRQVWQYLEGKISESDMIEQAKSATRQLAKRQLTWLRSWPNLKTYDFKDDNLYEAVRDEIVKHCL